MNGLKPRMMSYQQREEHKLHVPVGLEIDKIVRSAVWVSRETRFSSPAVVARLGQRHSSRATMDLNREIEEPCGRLLVRLLYGTCSRKRNALPSHPLTVCS